MPASKEDMAATSKPRQKIRRRPNLSASLPPGKTNITLPNTCNSVNELTCLAERPKSEAIAGIASVPECNSKGAINDPSKIMNSDNPI